MSQDTRDGLAGLPEYMGRFAAGYVDGFGLVLLLGFAICSGLVFGLASTELARVTHVRLVSRTW